MRNDKMRCRKIIDDKGNIKVQRYYSPSELLKIRQNICRQEMKMLKEKRKLIQNILYKEQSNEYSKKYHQKPEVKQRMKEYMKKYQKNPEVKQRIKEYLERPEVKKRISEYHKQYYKKKLMNKI